MTNAQEASITCRICKRSLIGLTGYTKAEEHALSLGWIKEVGYTLDTWVCTECAKKRINQEQTYSAGASYATVTTYCDTCSCVHSCQAIDNADIINNLNSAGWVQVNDKIYKWRCPSCWRATIFDVRKKLEQATTMAKENIMSARTVKQLNINEGVTTIFCAKCPAAYSSKNVDDNMSVELFNMGWRNVNLVPHGMNWICSSCARKNLHLVQVIFPTGMSSTTSTPKKPERENQYPVSLVFTSGKEEIYHVTEKTRDRLTDAVTGRQAIRFNYFIKTNEDEPSGVFACPADKIERMQ